MTGTIDELVRGAVRTVRRDAGRTEAASGPNPGPEPTVEVDARGEPYRVSTPDGVFPAVVIPPGTSLRALAATGPLVRMVTRTVPGVVVAGAGRPIGFVPRRALVHALLDHSTLRGEAGPDPLLHGIAQAVSGAVRIRCLTCGSVNAYDYCLPGEQKACVNGHPLDPDLE
ncbi:hypothetical protein [Streptomyces sp. NPDC046759]|uniref:hypothetical protein n=1 Tax=Streptomyces sp. NPDC046759 TaxID=3155019 RepID=UPI003408CFFF